MSSVIGVLSFILCFDHLHASCHTAFLQGWRKSNVAVDRTHLESRGACEPANPQIRETAIAEDMRGPAQILQSAAVSGADFLQWQDAATLQNDLKLLPFVAAKLPVRRDDFLAGSV